MHPLSVGLEEIEPLVNEDDVEDGFPADGVGKTFGSLFRDGERGGDGIEDLESLFEVWGMKRIEEGGSASVKEGRRKKEDETRN